jgi:hypothetical protein
MRSLNEAFLGTSSAPLFAVAGLLAIVGLSACATRTGSDGQPEAHFSPAQIAKSDVDRVIDANRRELDASFKRLAEKLYRRNPREWKKAEQPSLEEALARLSDMSRAHAELDRLQPDLRESKAALAAFREDYSGDRVLALISGLRDMVDAAFEHKSEFYMLDSLDAQKLYNCARNVEIAVWKLNSARNGEGLPVLYANEGDPGNRNLSFEREFGRVIGLLDFLSIVVADKNGRNVTRFAQNVATAFFLPVKDLMFTK